MPHCQRYRTPPLSRREMLRRSACGFGTIAAAALLAERGMADNGSGGHPLPPSRTPHFSPRVKHVIFLYMDGGPSQVDTFDPKPRLQRDHGQTFGLPIDTQTLQFDNMGKTLASPWKFHRYGQSGIPVSDLFPHVARHVDSLVVIRSMVSKFSEHTFANYFLHTGHGIAGRPSMGAWVSYGLGSENQNLPGFVVLDGGLTPPGGLDNFLNGFLPATYQASVLKAQHPPLANLVRQESTARLQGQKLKLIEQLDRHLIGNAGAHDALETAIANQEMAARMQLAVPELMDLSDETARTCDRYGLRHPFANTRTYGRLCLMARRLVERGVRFIELTCSPGNGDRWDQHQGLQDGHRKNALSVDQPIAALLSDLKQRGLFEETLVVWGGEFGRTPFAQGADGRDHNPFGFSIWLAGGGVQGGTIYGATDEFGYRAVENKVEIYDLHATMLHLLGLDHERLTVRFSARDMRLTDVHGHVLEEILA